MLDWAAPEGLSPVYRHLIRLRKDLAALHPREWATLLFPAGLAGKIGSLAAPTL